MRFMHPVICRTVVRLHASRSAEEAHREAPQRYILRQGIVTHHLLFVVELISELFPLFSVQSNGLVVRIGGEFDQLDEGFNIFDRLRQVFQLLLVGIYEILILVRLPNNHVHDFFRVVR